MTLEELKQCIKNKSFTDQFDTIWTFIPDDTLSWGTNLSIGKSVNYEFVEDGGLIYLKHGGAFGTNNDMTVDILEEEPLEITLMDKHNPKNVFVLA